MTLMIDLMTKKTKLPSDFNKILKGMSQKNQMTACFSLTLNLLTKKTKLPSDFNLKGMS